ncbi:MAG: hypothetical protein A3F25_01540 [Candidatus Yanofskybacteria bacterium RIFCSPHIGHO2_12_FULL_45_19b]|uniref:Methyltransferase domain-containing protein n=1 Tax=Candidatus Yanofskybacteria bacterium RIFCSPHIGHO2_12_FULL_45_19b TaxID=1802689 RepID=A0A1F8G4C5_9BACT|nr:MAG: hypothetical protein A3F25_01540 [Candidatus Yanofskybacteria bacterium RIFCSPHIGHO2_12_FULL_45_19b]
MFDFKKATENVGGWLTRAEGLFLYNTAKKVKAENVIVEIGSWKGRSAICLGNGSKDGNKAKIFAIDPHVGSPEHQKRFRKIDTFEEFRQNIDRAGVAHYIEPVRDTSENAAENFKHQVELVFIDGHHGYKFVKLDFNLWFPKVVNGGILAFHDSWHLHFAGPYLVTAILLLTSSRIKNPQLVDTITCFEKVEKNSAVHRLENIGFLIYRALFGIIGFFKLILYGRKAI